MCLPGLVLICSNLWLFVFTSELSSNPSLASILIPAHARSKGAASTPTNASATTGQNILAFSFLLQYFLSLSLSLSLSLYLKAKNIFI